MKLATYNDGSRDGQLVVVSRDLGQAHYASHIANRLQQVLDDWNYLSPLLQDLYDALNAGRARHAFAFEPVRCMAPLPRAFHWAYGGAYPGHRELLYAAQGLAPPIASGPEMVQGASDHLCGAHAPIAAALAGQGLDFEAQVAVVTGDIAAGCSADRAIEGVRLIVLANHLRLYAAPADLGGTLPESAAQTVALAFSPVAVTPDELGDAWRKGRMHLPVQCTWNGRRVGMCDADAGMVFHFGQLIAHLAQTRPLSAGSIVGSGVICPQAETKKGATRWPQGYCSIATKRAMEILQDGQATTAFMQAGDSLRVEVKNAAGHSVFGAIAQEVAR